MGRLKGDTVAKGHPALAPLSLEYLHPSKVRVEQESLCVLGAYSSNRRSLALQMEQPHTGKKSQSIGAFWRGLHNYQPPK